MKHDHSQFTELEPSEFIDEMIDDDGFSYSEVTAPVDEWHCDKCGGQVGFLLNDDVEERGLSSIVWVPTYKNNDGTDFICEECMYA